MKHARKALIFLALQSWFARVDSKESISPSHLHYRVEGSVSAVPESGSIHSKKGTPCTEYLRIASSLMSTPIPGFSDTLMKPFSTCGPS